MAIPDIQLVFSDPSLRATHGSLPASDFPNAIHSDDGIYVWGFIERLKFLRLVL
jgi:hypothetical protein